MLKRICGVSANNILEESSLAFRALLTEVKLSFINPITAYT